MRISLLLSLALMLVEPPPASRPSAPVEFQPGVWIDWQAREVLIEGRVVLRAGMLEFFACWSGKEHESVVQCVPQAAHVYMALGLVGLTPGATPRPGSEDAASGPTGDLVDVLVEWETDRGRMSVPAAAWLREIQYGRTPHPRPWIFCGSERLPDGTLASDVTGAGLALVDFPDALLCYSRRYPSDYAALWAEANTAAIPADDTRVVLRLRAARPVEREIRLDWRGDVYVDGRYSTAADLVDLLRLGQRLAPQSVQVIETGRSVRAADVARVRAALRAGGVLDGGVRWVARAESGSAAASQQTR